MNIVLDAGVAIYVAMAVALAVWIGIFVYLWRIDAQAQALKAQLEREHGEVQRSQGSLPVAPRATVTRVEK
jgi:CcmD family protein